MSKPNFTVEDLANVKRLIQLRRTDIEIAEIYSTDDNKFSTKSVQRFRKKHNLKRYTNLTEKQIDQHLAPLQQNESQMHGYRTVLSHLIGKRIRLTEKQVRDGLHRVAPDLVNARNPAQGAVGVRKKPLLSAGPMYRMHFDQYEKLWAFGIMVYGQRDRTAGYIPQTTVLRNKKPSSILLSVLRGIEHLGGAISLESMFDKGKEAKEVHEFYWKHIGSESVYTGTSQDNNVQELFWRLLHDHEVWIFRVELYHSVFLLLLDINNPLQISCVWSAFAHDVQWHFDYYISYGVNNSTMYGTTLLFVIVCYMRHLHIDENNHVGVSHPEILQL